MEIFGIGPLELAFILLLVILVLGPKDMQKTGRTIGHWLNTLLSSDSWKTISQFSREIRNLPNKLMREARLEEGEANDHPNQVGKKTVDQFRAWTTPSDYSIDSGRKPGIPPQDAPHNDEEQPLE